MASGGSKAVEKAQKKQDIKDASKKAIEKAVKKDGLKGSVAEKTKTDTEFNAAILEAARHAAEVAVQHYKSTQNQAASDAKDLKADSKSEPAPKKSPAAAIKAAVKKSIIKKTGVTDIADKSSSGDVDISSGPQSALDKVRWVTYKTPGDFGLNPAAATGISIAKATLEKSEKLSNISFGLSTPVPTGISKQGLLDDEDDV